MSRILGLTIAVLIACVTMGAQAAVTRPNILLIVVDELGWRDISCYGSTFYQTVNMDRLANEGMRFTDAYSAQARCAFARFGIMTGKNPARIGDAEAKLGPMDQSFGKAFQDAGYATFYCGKWHLGGNECGPEQQGFAATVGSAGNVKSHFAPYGKGKNTKAKDKFSMPGLDNAPQGEYLADRLTDETIKFVRSHRDKPFFAVLAHYAAHAPIEAKPGYIERYSKKLKEHPVSGPAWEKENDTENKLHQDDPVYAAMIHSVDEGVGRILDMLQEFKIADRTIVVLTSDHGGLSAKFDAHEEPVTSNRPLRAGKWHFYEGGIRVPLIVKWPSTVKPGSECKLPVVATDLYPTFLEMAKLPLRPEQHVDGISFVPLLKGTVAASEREFYWHHPGVHSLRGQEVSCSAIRCGKYKLLDFFADNRLELFDLSADIGERKNLIQSMPEKGAELKGKLDAWRKEVKASTLTVGQPSGEPLKAGKRAGRKQKR